MNLSLYDLTSPGTKLGCRNLFHIIQWGTGERSEKKISGKVQWIRYGGVKQGFQRRPRLLLNDSTKQDKSQVTIQTSTSGLIDKRFLNNFINKQGSMRRQIFW